MQMYCVDKILLLSDVEVCCVNPGVVDTDLYRNHLPEGEPGVRQFCMNCCGMNIYSISLKVIFQQYILNLLRTSCWLKFKKKNTCIFKMIERCEQTIITRISGLIKTPHTGCATTVYAAVNPELIGISRGYYKHSRAAPSWPSKAGRWDIILPVSRISKLQQHDIFEKKKHVSVRQCKIAAKYFTGFFLFIKNFP